MAQVVNVKVSYIRPEYSNLKEWCEDDTKNNVYIGRKGIVFIDGVRYPKKDSIWSNPFKIGSDGTREEVIEKYRKMLLNNPELLVQLPGLKGKTLGCWCKPLACHGDILVELLNECNEVPLSNTN